MAKLEPIMDQRISAFKQEMQHMRKRGFTRTGVGTDKYAPKRRIDIVQGKARTDRCKELEKQSKEQKLNDDNKKYVQEMLEIMEAFQKKKRVTHQSVDAKKKSSQRLETQTPEQEQPLLVHKGPIVHTENVEAKKNTEQVVVHNQSLQTSLELCCEPKQCHTLEHENDKAKESTKGKNQLSVPTYSQASLELAGINSWEQVAHSARAEVELEGMDIESCDRVSHSDGDKMELDLYTSSQGIEFEQSGHLEAKVISNLLCGTQVSLAYESIQYLNNIIFTRSFKQSSRFGCVLNVEISSIIHLILPLSAKEDTGSMNECNSLNRTTAMRSLSMNQTEQSTHLVQEPILMPFPCKYTRKYCKEIELVEPNLFVIVSAKDEKRFGLENVKEFRISGSVFDKLVPSFETLTPERLFNKMEFLFDDGHAYRTSMGASLCSNVFDMFRSETNCALIRTWPELVYLFKNMLIEPCKLNVKDNMLELNHSNMILNSLSNESMFDHLERLFFYSKRTFDVVSLVFVQTKERQVKDSRAKTIQVLSNQADYGSSQHMSFPFGFWNWKYLRKTRDLGLSQSESTNQEFGRVVRVYSIYKDKPPDVLLVLRSDVNFQQANTHQGSKPVFRRTKRVQVWEEDQRFKPPNFDQPEHNDYSLFFLIKEEPPDATTKPKTRLHIFGGNFLAPVHCVITNLLYSHAGHSDMRDFSTLAVPLKEVIKWDVGFRWEQAPEHACQALKETHTNAPILSLPDFLNTFEIECVAYGAGIVAVLMQEKKSIAYFCGNLGRCKKGGLMGQLEVAKTLQTMQEYYHCLQMKRCVERMDGPFKIIKKINNQAYEWDYQGKYSSSNSFNVADLVPYVAEGADLRSNPSQEGGDDIRMAEQLEPEHGDKEELGPEELEQALEIPIGPITRAKAKKLQAAVGTMLNQAESNLSSIANPTTLVVIQAS